MRTVNEKRYLRELSRISMRANEFRDTIHVSFDGNVTTMYFDGTHFMVGSQRIIPRDPELYPGGIFYGITYDLLKDMYTADQIFAISVDYIC